MVKRKTTQEMTIKINQKDKKLVNKNRCVNSHLFFMEFKVRFIMSNFDATIHKKDNDYIKNLRKYANVSVTLLWVIILTKPFK